MSVEKLPYFYDERLNQLKCFYYRNLLLTIDMIKTKGPKIDISASCKGHNFKVSYVDGTFKQYFTWTNFYDNIKEDFGININLQKSKKTSMNSYILTLVEPLQEYLGKITPVVEEEEELAIEEEVSVEEEEEETQSNIDSQEIDYELLNSFYDDEDKSGSKDKLESYVLETYSVDLRKNKSFQNMIVELEEKLAE